MKGLEFSHCSASLVRSWRDELTHNLLSLREALSLLAPFSLHTILMSPAEIADGAKLGKREIHVVQRHGWDNELTLQTANALLSESSVKITNIDVVAQKLQKLISNGKKGVHFICGKLALLPSMFIERRKYLTSQLWLRLWYDSLAPLGKGCRGKTSSKLFNPWRPWKIQEVD
jgi:hypothetical protein